MPLSSDIKTTILGIRQELNKRFGPMGGRVLIVRKELESQFTEFFIQTDQADPPRMMFGFTILFRHQIMDYLPLVEIGESLLPPICPNCGKTTKGLFCASCGANIPTHNPNAI